MRRRALGSLIVAVITGCCLARAGHAFVGQQAPAIDSAKRNKLSVPPSSRNGHPTSSSRGSTQARARWRSRHIAIGRPVVRTASTTWSRTASTTIAGCFKRVIRQFVAEFGINGDPEIQKAWDGATIADDMVRQSNKRGFVTFMKAAPDSPINARIHQRRRQHVPGRELFAIRPGHGGDGRGRRVLRRVHRRTAKADCTGSCRGECVSQPQLSETRLHPASYHRPLAASEQTRASVEEVAVFLDVRRQVERVLPATIRSARRRSAIPVPADEHGQVLAGHARAMRGAARSTVLKIPTSSC